MKVTKSKNIKKLIGNKNKRIKKWFKILHVITAIFHNLYTSKIKSIIFIISYLLFISNTSFQSFIYSN